MRSKVAALLVLGCLAATSLAQTKTRQCRGEHIDESERDFWLFQHRLLAMSVKKAV